jgi:hypothetical protein
VAQTESFGLSLCTFYRRTSGPRSAGADLNFVEMAGASGAYVFTGEAVATVGGEAGV